MASELANILRDALAVEVPGQVRHRCRQKVMAGAERILARKQAGSFKPGARRSLILKPVALAAALFTLLSAGTAWAATGADPDGWLYPVKQRLEDARTSIALQNIDQARVQVARAQTRLDEIENMVGRGRPDYVPGLLADYDSLMVAATGHLREAAAEGEATAEVEMLAGATRARYDELLKSLSGPGLDETSDNPGGATATDTTGAAETGGGGTQNGGGMGNNDTEEFHAPGGSDAEPAGPGMMAHEPSTGPDSPDDTGSGGSDSHKQDAVPSSDVSSQSDPQRHEAERPAAPMPGR